MEPFTLEWVLRALTARSTLIGSTSLGTRFTGISTDSRTVRPGELFVAIPGERFDGNLFVKAALERGALGAIAREDCPFQTAPGRPVVVVKDPVAALGEIAAEYRRKLKAKVVAITGSSGKTTTRDLLKQLVSGARRAVAAEKSHNNQVGVPITIFKADASTEVLILECGTNAPGEIDYLARIALPDVAVVTNVGACHLEKLGDEDGVALEKGALVERLRDGGAAVLNADDRRVRAMTDRLAPGRRAVFFSGRMSPVPGAPAPVAAGGAPTAAGRSAPDALLGPDALEGVALPFAGEHNRMNALAALAAAAALGIDPREVASRLADAELPGRRLERHALPGGVALIDDAYNANPASTVAALEVLARSDGRKVFVFGGMRELGAHGERHHRLIGEAAQASGVTILAAVGPDARVAAQAAIQAGLPAEKAILSDTPEEAADRLATRLEPGDQVLVKGSRAATLERFIDRLRLRLDPAASAARPGPAAAAAHAPARRMQQQPVHRRPE
jgi:UDP-N-acetylmuramoyl-tripeptide--D-alanyl-D-alanine ligase